MPDPTEGKDGKKQQQPQGGVPNNIADYKTLQLNDYIAHTKVTDSQFEDFFPTEKREQQLKQNIDFRNKYGEFAANRDWWGDVANQMVPSEYRRLQDVVQDVAKNENIDPAFLYSNAMEEGFGKVLHGKTVGGYEGVDKDYPINGMVTLGLDNFGSDYSDLKKYLPENFDYKPLEREGYKGGKVISGTFKSPTDALTAMGAYLRQKGDAVDKLAKQKGIKLSDVARQFFVSAAYNGGQGNASKMMDYYKGKGLLKNDAFLKNNALAKDKYGEIYEHVRRRLDAVGGLVQEGKLDFSPDRDTSQTSWMKGFEGIGKYDKNGIKVIEPLNKEIPFDIVYIGKKRKVIPRGTDIEKVDVNKLPDLDYFSIDNNIAAANSVSAK